MKHDIGAFIQHHRIKSGYRSQRGLANESGISAATISRIEKNIQKPNPETLKELSKYLKTTSYVELMVVAGYWDEEELLEPINLENEGPSLIEQYLMLTKTKEEKVDEPPVSYATEKEFVKKLEMPLEELLKQFNLTFDGKELTEEEAKGVIAYLRSLRQMK